MSKLSIYRCSAGSGKTFKITEEYLILLFTNPDNYKHILSVTFTNKAMEEMKSRILTEIYNLSYSENSSYFDIITKKFKISGQQVKKIAKNLLSNILHDYSRFSVETIESFFQKILRSFIREIGINSGYNLEFNTNKVLDEVIDILFMDIDENKSLRQWLIQFAENKISEGKSWDLKNDIFKLSHEVLKEEFLLFSEKQIEKFSNKSFLFSYSDDLKKITSGFESYLVNIGKSALKLIENHSLEIADFSFSYTGIAGYFLKLANKSDFDPKTRAKSCLNNPDKWYAKNSKLKNEIIECYNSGLNELLRNAIDYYDSNKVFYETSNVIINKIFALGILLDISKKIKEYCFTNNILLISNTTKILSDVIDNSDAPFIYEKTGYYYKHFMIDEFQDTSGLQWKNFKPLIDNSLSEDNKCMLVGDVKQSIYRWRNGNWNLLAEEVEKQYKQFGINDLKLSFNWRSKKNIVDFNNTFFAVSVKILQELFNSGILEDYQHDSDIENLKTIILRAYKDIYQELPDKKYENDGYVKLSFIENSETENWEKIIIDKIPVMLENFQDRGYNLNDIAIIVRDNKHGKEVAEFLLNYKIINKSDKYKYDVISNESLIVNNSLHVKFLIHLVKYFANPADSINNAFIINHYISYIEKKSDIPDENENIKDNKIHACFYSVSQDFERIKTIFIENQSDFEKLKFLPLYELIEEFIRIFGLNNNVNEIPYLQSFQDYVQDFIKNKSGDINSFIEWWEEEGVYKSLSISSKQDAVTITTIHKSKGLEFKVVIIPFCNWEIEAHPFKANIIWCRPEIKPFNNLDLIPVLYSSKLADTIFYKDYYYEKVQQFIDNLNLLYVASTRAEDELYIFSPVPKKLNDSKTVSDLIFRVFNNNDVTIDSVEKDKPLLNFNEFWNKESLALEIGKLNKICENNLNKKADKSSEIKQIEYPSFKKNQHILLKNYSFDYFSETSNKINTGNLYHSIFENIITLKDIDKAISKLYYEGKITSEDKIIFKEKISVFLNNEKVKEWFSDKWKVLTEPSILMNNGKIKHPDRVLISDNEVIVIDYKFGKEELINYEKQVKEYTDCMLQMNYKNVKGYIWYVLNNNIVEVTEN